MNKPHLWTEFLVDNGTITSNNLINTLVLWLQRPDLFGGVVIYIILRNNGLSAASVWRLHQILFFVSCWSSNFDLCILKVIFIYTIYIWIYSCMCKLLNYQLISYFWLWYKVLIHETYYSVTLSYLICSWVFLFLFWNSSFAY